MGKLTRHARMQPCTVRLPACCNAQPETTVFAHAPSVSKGMGIKSEDWWGAYACSSCHDVLDGRTRPHVPIEVIYEAWLRGVHETTRLRVRDGLIIVND